MVVSSLCNKASFTYNKKYASLSIFDHIAFEFKGHDYAVNAFNADTQFPHMQPLECVCKYYSRYESRLLQNKLLP